MNTTFSPCRTWRYTLERGPYVGWPGSRVLFVCLNPSTADETNDDATVRICISFAQDSLFERLTVCNLFSIRSKDPAALYEHVDPVGPENDRWIRERATGANLVIAAWGNHGRFMERGAEVLAMLRELGPVHVIAMNKTGEPKHPLYTRRGFVPERLDSV